MDIKRRQFIEKKIATKFVNDALAAGYTIGIDNGGDDLEYKGTDKKKILSEMFATDEEHLYVFKPNQNKPFGWVYFIYGECGWDVINDYTVNLESLLTETLALAEKYQLSK